VGPALEQTLCQHAARSRTSDNSLVFPSRDGTYQRPGNLHKRCLLPACAKAELSRVSWHAFRRTHATLLSDMGEPLKTAQAQLGHASLSTTAEIYAQAVPASQRAAVERLEKAVGLLVDPSGPKWTQNREGGSTRKFANPVKASYLSGAPGGTRTPDLLVRSQTLYPTELRARGR